jgi:hypothetical protein
MLIVLATCAGAPAMNRRGLDGALPTTALWNPHCSPNVAMTLAAALMVT